MPLVKISARRYAKLKQELRTARADQQSLRRELDALLTPDSRASNTALIDYNVPSHLRGLPNNAQIRFFIDRDRSLYFDVTRVDAGLHVRTGLHGLLVRPESGNVVTLSAEDPIARPPRARKEPA